MFLKKKLIPKTLFYRFVLIMLIPTILAQLVIGYIFYKRNWGNVNSSMTNSLTNEIAAIIQLFDQKIPQDTINIFNNELELSIKVTPYKKFYKLNTPTNLKKLDKSLNKKIDLPYNLKLIDNHIALEIHHNNSILTIQTTKFQIDNHNTRIFIFWMISVSILFFVLAIIFSKNQIKPIIKLAKAIEDFGKGYKIKPIKPYGSSEIQKATKSFILMKDRIEKNLTQRTEMLSGISHDLRTSLTRMKLLIEINEPNFEKDLKIEITEMENMINSYLSYTKTSSSEPQSKINIKLLLQELTNKYKNSSIKIGFYTDKTIYHKTKKQSLKRIVHNIVDNSINYAQNLFIDYNIYEEKLHLTFEDNGPGIPQNEYKNIFKPFYRIESSRNNKTGGIGLGLAIVKDLVTDLGGEIKLSTSEQHKGLKIIIIMP